MEGAGRQVHEGLADHLLPPPCPCMYPRGSQGNCTRRVFYNIIYNIIIKNRYNINLERVLIVY